MRQIVAKNSFLLYVLGPSLLEGTIFVRWQRKPFYQQQNLKAPDIYGKQDKFWPVILAFCGVYLVSWTLLNGGSSNAVLFFFNVLSVKKNFNF